MTRTTRLPFGHRLAATGSAALLLASALQTGCATTDASFEESSDDLTSSTALAREMKFAGLVYVPATAGDYEILQAVRKQTQSAFGAFREATVAVSGSPAMTSLEGVVTSTLNWGARYSSTRKLPLRWSCSSRGRRAGCGSRARASRGGGPPWAAGEGGRSTCTGSTSSSTG